MVSTRFEYQGKTRGSRTKEVDCMAVAYIHMTGTPKDVSAFRSAFAEVLYTETHLEFWGCGETTELKDGRIYEFDGISVPYTEDKQELKEVYDRVKRQFKRR